MKSFQYFLQWNIIQCKKKMSNQAIKRYGVNLNEYQVKGANLKRIHAV